jgi:hypothetical protein
MISFSCTRAPLTVVCDAETYRMRGWPCYGLDSVANYWIYVLRLSKALCCSSPQSKWSEPLSTRKKGRLRSASFNMNLFCEAILLDSFLTPFFYYGGFICIMALILSGLASIPFTNTRHSNDFPLCTPDTHFLGLSFSWTLRMLVLGVQCECMFSY